MSIQTEAPQDFTDDDSGTGYKYVTRTVYPDDDAMIEIIAAFERFCNIAEDRIGNEGDRMRLFEIYISQKGVNNDVS